MNLSFFTLKIGIIIHVLLKLNTMPVLVPTQFVAKCEPSVSAVELDSKGTQLPSLPRPGLPRRLPSVPILPATPLPVQGLCGQLLRKRDKKLPAALRELMVGLGRGKQAPARRVVIQMLNLSPRVGEEKGAQGSLGVMGQGV